MALISVSGHCKDPSGANIAGSVVFQLVNYGASIPRVIGTNALVPTNVTFTAAASGAWSGNIQSNDSIDPGASNTPPTTYYVVTFKDANGANIQSVPFNFTGAGPANLDSQGPLVTIPSPTAPPNTAALLAATQTFTGNDTFTGTTTINTLVAASATLTTPTITNPTTTGTDIGVETLQNKILNGVSSGNSISLLNYQGNKGALTGNAADQAIYSYTLPANTVAVGKGIRVSCSFSHSAGTASVAYKVKLNGVTLHNNSSSGTGGGTISDLIMAPTATAVDSILTEIIGAAVVTSGSIAALTGVVWASNQALEVDVNVANTDQITPFVFVVELVQ